MALLSQSMVRGFSDVHPGGQIHRGVAHCLWSSRGAFCDPVLDNWNQPHGFKGQRSGTPIPIDCIPRRCGIVAASAPTYMARKAGKMIQPLRRLHLRIFFTASVALPLVFLAGLLARRPFPLVEIDLPREGEWPAEFSGYLKSFKETLTPDALVYWSPLNPSGQALLPEARLLGSPHGNFVSNGSLPSDGYLLLYSLAQQKVIAAQPFARKEKLP